jgi:hypothetical protein
MDEWDRRKEESSGVAPGQSGQDLDDWMMSPISYAGLSFSPLHSPDHENRRDFDPQIHLTDQLYWRADDTLVQVTLGMQPFKSLQALEETVDDLRRIADASKDKQ